MFQIPILVALPWCTYLPVNFPLSVITTRNVIKPYMYYCPYQCEVITNTFPSFTYHNDERYKYLIPFFQPAMETIQPQKAFDRELLLDRKGLFLCFKDNLCDCMTLTCGGCHLLCHSCG